MAWVFLFSAVLSSAVIFLIIGFLIKEGAGLFRAVPLDFGMVIVADPRSGIESLDPEQIRHISEGAIADWSEVGAAQGPTLWLDYDDLDNQEEHATLTALIAATPGAVGAVFEDELTEDPAAAAHVRNIRVPKVGVLQFLTGRAWYPTAEPAPQFGILALILGSLLVTAGAIVVALPMGLAAAIYLAEVARPNVRAALKPIIELLAGIPSVVYGFFGLVVVVPFLQRMYRLDVGETALAGIIMLAIMALPTIISVSEDALTAVPRSYREASLALGGTQWQTIIHVVVPSAISGISAAVILGVGRAVGETMTVLMVTGNAAQIPTSLLKPVRTLTATIAAELGEAPQGGIHYQALFAVGIALFLSTFLLNIVADWVAGRREGD